MFPAPHGERHYGKPLTNEEILTGTVKRPATAGPFLAQLQRFSGKGAPPAVIPAKSHQQSTPKSDQAKTAAATLPSSSSNTAPDADNTAKDQPDQAASATTAAQQQNGTSDLDLTASIRRSIVADGSLSTYGHNVKIVVQNGVATLKGPVGSEEEEEAIAAKAAGVVGQDHVVDQMEVTPQ